LTMLTGRFPWSEYRSHKQTVGARRISPCSFPATGIPHAAQKGIYHCLLLSLVCVALSGCAANRINLWPIYYQETMPAETGGETVTLREVLWPFFSQQSGPKRSYHAVRPFYNYEALEKEGTLRIQYLWPLGLHFSRKGDMWQHRLLPLYNHSVHQRREAGGKAVRGMLFPLFWWGSKPETGSYFAFFPLGGVIRDLLGDRWSFALFPLFSAYRKGNYNRYDFLWPFFSVGGTPDGKRKKIRLWPLYVHDKSEGRYDQHYVLWPFLAWGTECPGGIYTQRYFKVWPFYGRKEARDRQGKMVGYHTQVLFFSRRKDLRPGLQSSEWSFLWFAGSAKKPEVVQTRIFPFYWSTTQYVNREKLPERKWTRRRILWPLVWIDHNMKNPEVEEKNLVVAPFYWDYARTYGKGEEEREKTRRITLWPLFTWQRDRDGAAHFWMLSHGWKDAPQGFKRNYRPFFELFQHHAGPGGEHETRLLWRLFHLKRTPSDSHINLLWLFEYDSSHDGEKVREKTVSALFGLVQYRVREGRKSWRLLYIPLGTKDAGEE